jgi:hypothetical protein
MSRSIVRSFAFPVLAAALLSGVAIADPAAAVTPPDNDLFSRAENLTLGGCDVAAEGDNFDATGQPGEPVHFSVGSLPTQSSWSKWTSPVTDTVVVDTIGSDFDTILAVYRGRRIVRLAPVAADDDSGGDLTSSLTFEARRDVTYRIAVDGFSTAQGNYLLNITC